MIGRLGKLIAVLALVALAVGAAQAQSSTFTGSNEGWRIATLTQPFNSGSGPGYPGTVIAAPYLNFMGNPAGSIGYWNVTEPGNYQYFLTPLAWNGNQSGWYGLTVQWDYAYYNGPWTNTWGDIAIRDTLNNRWLVADVTSLAPTVTTNPNNPIWNRFSVTLDTSGNWRIGNVGGTLATSADIQSALSNFGGFFIRGEVRTGTVEYFAMDNFRVVPEAGTLASMGAFMGMGLLWLRRRFTA